MENDFRGNVTLTRSETKLATHESRKKKFHVRLVDDRGNGRVGSMNQEAVRHVLLLHVTKQNIRVMNRK